MRIPNTFFLLVLLLFVNAFNFKDNPPSGWYQQFPNLDGATIKDMTFTDSLVGYIVTSIGGSNSYILKTTNGGDNWITKFMHTDPFVRVKFINSNTGFTNAFTTIFKTTNAGENWTAINLPDIFGDDMYVLNQDTIWLAMSESLTGGVFRTTNGGGSWTQQFSMGIQNPSKIYFYNAKTGFIGREGGTPNVRRTTDGGANWTVVVNNESFTDMHFIDSLNGFRSYSTMKKTTDGGLNWVNQPLPPQISGLSQISSFSLINKDTIWGVGGYVIYPNSQFRGVLYTTTNGGNNWYYGVPDTTSVTVTRYLYVSFVDKLTGWAYTGNRGIHTKVGGDPITSVTQNIIQIPSQFRLEQNYPNPFNPLTWINYELQITNYVTIKVYDLRGKEIAILINEKKNAGSYSVSFDASKHNLSSGIYFYSLYLDNKLADTKKMIYLA